MKILSAVEYSTKLRASVHASGRLGFSNEAAKSLGITAESSVKFGQDDDDPSVLYLIVPREGDEDCFPVKPSGPYYYVPTKTLFDALGVDYTGSTVIYDLVRMPSLDADCGGLTFRMDKRVIPGNQQFKGKQ